MRKNAMRRAESGYVPTQHATTRHNSPQLATLKMHNPNSTLIQCNIPTQHNYATQLRNTTTQHNYATQLRNTTTQHNYATQLRNTTTQHNYAARHAHAKHATMHSYIIHKVCSQPVANIAPTVLHMEPKFLDHLLH
jgi:hypothetical protein